MPTPTHPLLVTVNGLPLHPLVVHAVVVLLPLAALCAAGIALFPAWRRRFGWPVLALTLVAVLAVPVAISAGEDLAAATMGTSLPELIVEHQRLAEQLLVYAVVFGAATTALVVLGALTDRRWGNREGASGSAPLVWRILLTGVAAVVVVSAALTTVQVVRVGDSGSQSVWGYLTTE